MKTIGVALDSLSSSRMVKAFTWEKVRPLIYFYTVGNALKRRLESRSTRILSCLEGRWWRFKASDKGWNLFWIFDVTDQSFNLQTVVEIGTVATSFDKAVSWEDWMLDCDTVYCHDHMALVLFHICLRYFKEWNAPRFLWLSTGKGKRSQLQAQRDRASRPWAIFRSLI